MLSTIVSVVKNLVSVRFLYNESPRYWLLFVSRIYTGQPFIYHLLPGGGGKRGIPPPPLVFPVPEDPRSDAPPDLLLFPGIEIEKVCPSFKE